MQCNMRSVWGPLFCQPPLINQLPQQHVKSFSQDQRRHARRRFCQESRKIKWSQKVCSSLHYCKQFGQGCWVWGPCTAQLGARRARGNGTLNHQRNCYFGLLQIPAEEPCITMLLFHLSWIQSQFTCPRGFNLYWLFDSEIFLWDWTAMQLFLVALSIVSLVWAGTRMKFSPTQVTCAAPRLCLMMRETKPVGLWQLLQCLFEVLVPARYYDSKHTTPGSTKNVERSCAMVNAPCPSLPLPLSISLSTLLFHRGTVPFLAQEQEEGLEADLFICFQLWCLQGHTAFQKCEKWRR